MPRIPRRPRQHELADVLAGFDQHSDYRSDPESRLQRTAAFVTVTTFGTSRQAEQACERVRRAHAPVRGVTPQGRPYDAGDPDRTAATEGPPMRSSTRTDLLRAGLPADVLLGTSS